MGTGCRRAPAGRLEKDRSATSMDRHGYVDMAIC